MDLTIGRSGVDYESISVVTGSVSTLTASKVTPDTTPPTPPPTGAILTVEGNPIRMRLDGTDPTGSEGHKLDAGDSARISGLGNLHGLGVTTDTASPATVKVTYLR